MKIIKLFPFFIVFYGSLLYSQENIHTLDKQITEIIEKSNRYEDYKVVKMDKLFSLKKSVSDSIIALKNEIQGIKVTLTEKQNTIDSLSVSLNTISDSLITSRKKEEGISFFGSIIKKSVYNTIMLGVIALLLFSAFMFIFKFKRSNAVQRSYMLLS